MSRAFSASTAVLRFCCARLSATAFAERRGGPLRPTEGGNVLLLVLLLEVLLLGRYGSFCGSRRPECGC